MPVVALIPVVVPLLTKILSGIGKDQVPNYPIKKQSTYNGLVAVVRANVFPNGEPTSLAGAEYALAEAERWLAYEQGGKGDANTTIKMMYAEVISSLRASIAENKRLQGQADQGILPSASALVDKASAAVGTAAKSPAIWIVGALVAVVVGFVAFTRKGKKLFKK